MRPTASLWLVSATMSVALAGCGLVLDIDPPDPDSSLEGMDASQPIDAAGGMDAQLWDAQLMDGSADGSAADAEHHDAELGDDGSIVIFDATRPVDALAADSGRGGCTSHDECAGTQLCQRPPGRCFGPGVCVDRPATCAAVVAPVCGCDWSVYTNACEAEMGGTNVMRAGSCPTLPGGNWCTRTPAAMGSDGCYRCFDDADCAGLPLAPYCVASACQDGSEGFCALGPVALGSCWDDRQCRITESCEGERADTCELPLRTGRCRTR